MSKKIKYDMDLDFSEINNANNQKTSSNSETKPTKKNRPKRGQSVRDTILLIPSKDSSSKFISRTISECSASEFISWANHVAYPLNKNNKYYESEKNRINQFMRIVAFHKKNHIIANPDAYRTIH